MPNFCVTAVTFGGKSRRYPGSFSVARVGIFILQIYVEKWTDFSLPSHFFQRDPKALQGQPGDRRRRRLSGASRVIPGVSCRWDMPGIPHSAGILIRCQTPMRAHGLDNGGTGRGRNRHRPFQCRRSQDPAPPHLWSLPFLGRTRPSLVGATGARQRAPPSRWKLDQN